MELLVRRAHENWVNLCADNMCFGITCHGELMNIGATCAGTTCVWEYLSQGGLEHWGELSKGTVGQGRFKVVSTVQCTFSLGRGGGQREGTVEGQQYTSIVSSMGVTVHFTWVKNTNH
jgi:hypothetical protein